jgi:DNA polymerase III sliding clamp (beta) subunit (PCNA family)
VNLLISAAELVDAARSAALAVRADQGKRIPILNCCRLTADSNMTIYGTDRNTGITAIADCDVIEPGEVAVDAKALADIAGKLKGDVCISRTADELIIKSGRSRFMLTMQPVEDCPEPLAVEDSSPAIALSAADILAEFAGAAGAAQDDKRIYVAGPVLFSEPTDSGHRLCGVGADGVALSYAATATACPELNSGIIVHRETCKLAAIYSVRRGRR